jgi:hypothetical protein
VLRNQPRGNQEYDGNDKAPCLEAIDVRRDQNSYPKEKANRDYDYSGEHCDNSMMSVASDS